MCTLSILLHGLPATPAHDFVRRPAHHNDGCPACYTSTGEHVHLDRSGELSAGGSFRQNPLRLALPLRALCTACCAGGLRRQGNGGDPLANTSADEPARVECPCLERWCSLSCHPCRRIVPPKPAPGHGQSAFGLNKAPLRRLTHEISAAASSPPGSPLTPASAPAASSALGWCTLVCSESTACFLCLFTLASAPAACPDSDVQGVRGGSLPICSLLVQAVARLLPGCLLPLLCQVHSMDRDPMEASLCACLRTVCFQQASLGLHTAQWCTVICICYVEWPRQQRREPVRVGLVAPCHA